MTGDPLWLDPRYLPPMKARQVTEWLQAHEDEVRERERARERRRVLAVLVNPDAEECDFKGCYE